MAVRTIALAITANVQGLVANLHTAQAATQQFATNAGSYIDRNRANIDKTTRSAALLGAGMVAAAGVAVKAFADWDAQMAQVQSLTHATSSEMGQLRDATMQYAKDFGASASDAADAEIELVKAGVSTADIMGGALKGALTLASAGQLDVADATSIAASAMTQFGLKGQDVSHIADLLAAGADKALGSVGDLGQGLKYVGPVAASMGISLEQTVGVLSELAQNGILADQAGTSLRGMLSSLTSPSSEAAKVMDKYKISVYDASGQFVGFNGVAEQLKTKLGGLDQATRQQALGQIFGNQQITAATILMKDGAKGVDSWTKAVDANGFASEQANGKLNSLNGDLTKFKATIQNDLIGMGSGANGPLRGLVQNATDLAGAFGNLPDPIKQTALLITGGSGLAVLGVAGLAKLVVKIRDVKIAAAEMNVSLKTAGLAAGGIGLAIAAGAAALTIWASETQKAKAGTDDFKQSLIDTNGAITDATKGAVLDKLANDRQSLWEQLTEGGNGESALTAAKNLGVAADIVVNAALNLPGASDAYTKAMQQAIAAGKGSSTDIDVLNNVLDRTKDAFASGAKGADEYNKAQKDAGVQSQTAASQLAANASATDKYNAALVDGTATSEDFTSALKEQADALQKAAGIPLTARQATRDYQQSLDDATASLKKNGVTLNTNTAKGRDNQAALDKIASSAFDVVDAYAANGASAKTLQGKMAGARAEFIKTAEQMGMSKAQAKKLADQLGLIPKNVKVQVDAATDAAAAKIAALKASIQGVSTWHINADVSTANAYAAIAGLQKALGVGSQHSGLPGLGGGPLKKADGGEISGPGTGTSDSILARLSNGEFVVNAASYKKYGPLVRAVNSGSLPGFAHGGPVTSYKGHSLEYWQGKYASGTDYLKLKQTIKDDNSALKETEKYGKGNKLTRHVLRGLDRAVANSQLRDDQKALTDANTARAFVTRYGPFAAAISARDKAKDAAAATKDKSTANAASKSDLNTSVRRGSVSSAVSGGLDSALGVVDQTIAESKDTNLTKGQRSSLAKTASDAEPALKRLYASADGIQKNLDKAKDKLSNLKDIAASAGSVVSSTFDLSKAYNAAGTMHTDAKGNTWYDAGSQGYTKGAILSTAKAQATTASTFATKLAAVQKKLGSGAAAYAITQQAMSIFGSDPDSGLQFLDAINSMSTSEIGTLKGDYSSLTSAASSVGNTVTDAYATGGQKAAQAFVDQLTANQSKVNAQIAAWGTTLTNAMLSPYGEKLDKSGKIVKKALGGWVDGPGTGTSDSVRAMLSKGEFVVNAQAAKANAGMLEWINSRAATTVLPVLAPTVTASPSTLPPIYVQNPFTGEYLLAKVSTVAGRVVASHAAAQDQKLAYTGVTAWH